MIRITNATVQSGSRIRLDAISCTIPKNRITTLIGSSGAGKTTLLRCLAGIEQLTRGSITLDTQQLQLLTAQQKAKLCGFVFQQYNLFPHVTVLENCILPQTTVLKVSYEEARLQAIKLLEQLGMGDYQKNYPSQLSGGQQQRVAIARALCMGPKILLLDEPTSALDPANTATLVTLLNTLLSKGITIIIASQDMAFVRMVLDYGILINAGEIVDMYDKNVQQNPNLLMQNFLGE